MDKIDRINQEFSQQRRMDDPLTLRLTNRRIESQTDQNSADNFIFTRRAQKLDVISTPAEIWKNKTEEECICIWKKKICPEKKK